METATTSKTPHEVYSQVWPLIRLLLYGAILQNRILYAVPQYTRIFKHGFYVLPVHVVLSITQLILFELRRMQVLDPRLDGIDVLICVVWGILGLRLVRPLRRGHPATTRALYQLTALSRPLLEIAAWWTGSTIPYRLSIALLDSFVWVRVQLKFLQMAPLLSGAAAYAFAIPMSGVLGLGSSGLLWGLVPLHIGMIAVMSLNALVSWAVANRAEGRKQRVLWTFVDPVVDSLVTAGFAHLETLRALRRSSRVLTEQVEDDYGYITPELASSAVLSDTRAR